jgi:hypothetical protein
VNNIVEPVLKTVQVLSVVVAAVISIWSFNATREKEAEARRVEAIKPMVELRQKFYLEAARAASILADPGVYSKNEILSARKRFRQLYIVELSMVESGEVESQMVAFAKIVDPTLTNLTEAQRAAYNLAHGLASSFVATKEPR